MQLGSDVDNKAIGNFKQYGFSPLSELEHNSDKNDHAIGLLLVCESIMSDELRTDAKTQVRRTSQ
jgi:hypothetical protein